MGHNITRSILKCTASINIWDASIDKQLSGFDGLELCHLLKIGNRTKDVPVIVISATPDIKTLAAEAGANDALQKPFGVQLLKKIILGALS